MKLRPVYLFIAALSLTTAACSSSSSSTPAAPTTGTETLNAVLTGSAAAANLNSSSNAPLTFPEATWEGLIATTLKPFALGGGNAGDVHWATPAGTTTVYHAPAKGFTNENAPPPVTWTKSGTDCTFSGPASKGTFAYVPSKSTGEFARLSGTGTYLLTVQGTAPFKSGDASKACSFATIGSVTDSGAKFDFTATAPVTLKPETATP